MMRWLLGFLFLDFVLLSAWATWEVGYLGIFAAAVQGPGSMQIFADLCVALIFAGGWMRTDARKHGLPAWPFLVAIPFAGSLALVAYVAVRALASSRTEAGRTGSVAAG